MPIQPLNSKINIAEQTQCTLKRRNNGAHGPADWFSLSVLSRQQTQLLFEPSSPCALFLLEIIGSGSFSSAGFSVCFQSARLVKKLSHHILIADAFLPHTLMRQISGKIPTQAFMSKHSNIFRGVFIYRYYIPTKKLLVGFSMSTPGCYVGSEREHVVSTNTHFTFRGI